MDSKGCGGGLVVSMLAFYSDDLSSIPLKPSTFSVKCYLKRTKITKKRPWLAHLKTLVSKYLHLLFKITLQGWLEYLKLSLLSIGNISGQDSGYRTRHGIINHVCNGELQLKGWFTLCCNSAATCNRRVPVRNFSNFLQQPATV